MASVKSTEELINLINEHGKAIGGPEEIWTYLENGQFHRSYLAGLLAAGMAEPRAVEKAYMVRVYVQKIAESLRTANYILRELTAEVDEARSEVRNEHRAESWFRV